MLNRRDEGRHPCHFPDFRGKAFSLSPLSMMLAVGFHWMTFIELMNFPYISNLSVLFCFVFNKFIYFWLCWVFIAVCGLSLVVASRGYSLLRCAGFSLRWLLLLRSMGSRCTGFSSCGSRTLECRLSSCGARA